MIEITELPIKGCRLIKLNQHNDNRGLFVKLFQSSFLRSNGFDLTIKEMFFSESKRNVLRGLHFQSPPHDQDKFVYCINGVIFDAFVDIRKSSETYLQHYSLVLNSQEPSVLFLPRGIAHGFFTKSENATVLYLVTSEHEPSSDKGLLWNSCGIEWPSSDVIISERDNKFPKLSEFKEFFN